MGMIRADAQGVGGLSVERAGYVEYAKFLEKEKLHPHLTWVWYLQLEVLSPTVSTNVDLTS